jgi:formylglycine-generating enzyme required for sulfatase activity
MKARPTRRQRATILACTLALVTPIFASCGGPSGSEAAAQATEEATATSSPTATETPTLFTPAPTEIPDEIVDEQGVEMVLVPEGPFEMGNDWETVQALCDTYPYPGVRRYCSFRGNIACEGPQHTATLDAFFIDRYEVTNASYAECVAAGACPSKDTLPEAYAACAASAPHNCREHRLGSITREHYYDDPTFANYPVIYVTREEAVAYCEWRGARLPIEAEWEKAARGTDGRQWPWGDEFDGTRLNFCDVNCGSYRFRGGPAGDGWDDLNWNDGYADTAPVDAFPLDISPYGAIGMAGNVTEWVSDAQDCHYYEHSPEANPAGSGALGRQPVGHARRLLAGRCPGYPNRRALWHRPAGRGIRQPGHSLCQEHHAAGRADALRPADAGAGRRGGDGPAG